MGWAKVSDPALRSKGDSGLANADGKVFAAGGDRTDYLLAIECDTNAGQFAIWFEDLGWQQINYTQLPGFEYDAGTQHLNPMAWPGVVHHGRLKLLVTHWHGDGDGRRTLYLLDTGYQFSD